MIHNIQEIAEGTPINYTTIETNMIECFFHLMAHEYKLKKYCLKNFFLYIQDSLRLLMLKITPKYRSLSFDKKNPIRHLDNKKFSYMRGQDYVALTTNRDPYFNEPAKTIF